MADPHQPKAVASGVDELLRRLKDDGVAAGRLQAAEIVREAEQRAQQMLREAREEADRIGAGARREAELTKQASLDALRMAARDTVLELETRLTQRFRGKLGELIGIELKRSELLQRMIIEIAGQARARIADAEQVEILLPSEVIGLDELRRDPQELEQGALTRFTRLVGEAMLRDGVELRSAKFDRPGLRIRVDAGAVTIDFDDESLTAVLMDHLQPRFRALVEGIVR